MKIINQLNRDEPLDGVDGWHDWFRGIKCTDRKNPDKYQIIGYDELYNSEKILLCPLSRSSANISPEGRVLMCGMM